MSKTILLNQNWIFSKEGHDEPVTLPHTWNAVDGQDGGNDYYRGTCCYTTVLPDIVLPENGRAVLQFDAVAMTAEVYLNEQKLAEHKGGYSAFCVDITDALRNGSNLLRVNVDNSDNDTVYPQKADFTFYGGIYRDVTLHVVPAAHFALAENGAVPVRVTPIVTDLDARRCEVTVEAAVVGAESVTFTLDGQQTNVAVKDGNARAVFTLEHARLWDGLDDPYLYTVTARLDNGETETARFGCRKFEIDPQKGFILNGRPYPLRGVSRHQDRKGAGVAITKEMMEEDMALILEMGANTIRLAHYQHAQAFYDLCDEKGIVIWAEIPYITMHMHNGRANTLTQMEELIVQNYNHPCIAVWGLSNEITAASAVNEELLENHRALSDHDDINILGSGDGLEVDVEAVCESQSLALGHVGSDLLVVDVSAQLIGDQHHDDVAGLGSLLDLHDFEVGMSCSELRGLFPVSRTLAQANDDIDAALSEVLGMCVTLAAEADDSDGLAVQHAEVAVGIVVFLDSHGSCSPFVFYLFQYRMNDKHRIFFAHWGAEK